MLHIEEHPRVAYLFKQDKFYPMMANGLFLNELERQEYPSDAPIIMGLDEGEKPRSLQLLGQMEKRQRRHWFTI